MIVHCTSLQSQKACFAVVTAWFAALPRYALLFPVLWTVAVIAQAVLVQQAVRTHG